MKLRNPASRAQVRFSQIVRASALAPLLIGIPLLLFVLGFTWMAPVPAFGSAEIVLAIALGVVPIHLLIALGYLSVALVLRTMGILSRRTLFAAGGVISIAIGLQFVAWEVEANSPFHELARAFLVTTPIYLVVFTATSWLWWKLANTDNQSSPGPGPALAK